MNVGELKKKLAHYTDDICVVVAPKGWSTRHDWIDTHSGTGVSNREDTDVAAFVIDIAMTIPGDPVREVLEQNLIEDRSTAHPNGPHVVNYGGPFDREDPEALNWGNEPGVDRQQRQAEADIKREASNPVVFACTCLTKTGFRGATCKACGGIIRAGGGLD